MLPLEEDSTRFDTETDPACFMTSVSPAKAVRDAARDAEKKLSVSDVHNVSAWRLY